MAGIGWRHPHYGELLERRPVLDFLEVHSENFFAEGGAALAVLMQGRAHYDISLHGVGLGLGSAIGVDEWHLSQLARLVERVQPLRVSDHASFARTAQRADKQLTLAAQTQADATENIVHAADLLPIPFSKTALDVLCSNVQQVQDRLRRTIAVENLSAYVAWPADVIVPSNGAAHTQSPARQALALALAEAEFLNQLAARTGCQLLVDLNNVYVNALNAQKQQPQPQAQQTASTDVALAQCCAWVQSIAPQHIAEIHLAGHADCGDWVIDDHGSRVCSPVWTLYQDALAHWQPQLQSDLRQMTLIEWDTHIPALDVLLQEAAQADAMAQATQSSKGIHASQGRAFGVAA
jgi:uncharacterized protein